MPARKPSRKDKEAEKKPPIRKQIQTALDKICAQVLDDEYRKIAQRMLIDLLRHPNSQQRLSQGKPEAWAGGILNAIGRINFLRDPAFKPYLTQAQLAKACGISPTTLTNREKVVTATLALSNTADNYLTDHMKNLLSGMYRSLEQTFLNKPSPIVEALEQQGIPVSEEMADLVKFLEEHKEEHGPDVKITLGSDGVLVNGEPVLTLTSGNPLAAEEEDRIYELTIELLYMNPPVRRRIQTPDMPLDILHIAIQILMNWDDCHLHQFKFDGQWIPNEMSGDGDFSYAETSLEDEMDVYLSDLVALWTKKRKKTTIHYTYDFGDGWQVEIVIRKVLPQTEPELNHPICLAAEGVAPPEDCGGAPGFAELQEILANPAHPHHEDYFDSYGSWLKSHQAQTVEELSQSLLSLHRGAEEEEEEEETQESEF